MGVKVTNNAFGTLSASISTSDTTITLDGGQGARFPTLGAGDYFYGTLVDTSNNIEVVKVTARSTDSMTVVRGQDNTTASAFAIGDRFELRPTAALFESIIDEVAVDGITSSATGTAITIDSSNDVTVANDLTVSGIVDTPRLDLNNSRNVRMILGGETGANNTDDGGVEFHTDTHFSVYEDDDTNHRVFHIETNTGYVHMEKQPCCMVYGNNMGTVNSADNGSILSWASVHARTGITLSNSNGRMTVPSDGVYMLIASCCGSSTTNGNSGDGIFIDVFKNNAKFLGESSQTIANFGVNSGDEFAITVTMMMDLNANDYVDLRFSNIGSAAAGFSRGNFTMFKFK